MARFATLLASLAAALPFAAAGQTQLVRQCVSFGEVEYRKLDPSLDRIGALDSPVALERFNVTAGSQSVAAALTLRGRLSYSNRAAIETQLVCLLDGADKPIFFYAMPVVAAAPRTAPTPLGRGPAPPPQITMPLPPQAAQKFPPSRPPEATMQVLRPGTIRLRGLVRDLGGKLQFQPCDGAPIALDDRTSGQQLTQKLRELTGGQEGRPMFVEFYGARESGAGAGIGAVEMRRAAVETAGCRERFDQREWIATGSEPSWRLEVTGRELMLSVSGEPAPLRVPHGGLQRQDDRIVYTAGDGPPLVVTIEERRCIDSVTGSLFAYAVDISGEGRNFSGCMAHNPAMPAP